MSVALFLEFLENIEILEWSFIDFGELNDQASIEVVFTRSYKNNIRN